MNLFKKKNHTYLYIFFFIIVFIISEFSTNFVLANGYNITKIDVQENYDLEFEKSKVVDKAFRSAFKTLSYKILYKEDRNKLNNISLQEIKSLIESFTITNEKFINDKYHAQFDVQFNKKKILKFIEDKNIISSFPKDIKIFLLPILIDIREKKVTYLSENIYFKKWNKNIKNYLLLDYILPNEDIEDYIIMNKNIDNIENKNFNEIINKYNINNHIILIILKNENLIKTLSKIKIDEKNMIVNKFYKNDSINKQENVEKIILDLKEIYEDKWKSLNKLNTLISLPIRLSVSSKNIEMSEKLEKTLFNIDLISDFNIEKFDNKEIIYKIIYNSTPDKFLDTMLSNNFRIDTSSDLWKIN